MKCSRLWREITRLVVDFKFWTFYDVISIQGRSSNDVVDLLTSSINNIRRQASIVVNRAKMGFPAVKSAAKEGQGANEPVMRKNGEKETFTVLRLFCSLPSAADWPTQGAHSKT